MIIFVLENIRSVYNVGSIFRTGEGFGFKNFALVGITPTPLDKYGSKRKDFAKTALGSEDMVVWEYFETISEVFTKYPKYTVLSLELTENSKDISTIKLDLDQSSDYIFILGSEVDGVSQYALSKSKFIYKVPMNGKKESFNVSIATGICMYVLKNNTK